MQATASGSDLIDAVLDASRALVAVAARSLEAAPADITLAQYRALLVLRTRGSQRATALAAELGAQPSSVTRLCDRLEGKGLITRATAESSRREVEIAVTEAGGDVVERVLAARRVEIARIVGAVPAARRRAVVEALQDFATAAGEAPHQDWSLGWGP